MTNSRPGSRLLAPILLLALVAASCGGSESSSTAESTAPNDSDGADNPDSAGSDDPPGDDAAADNTTDADDGASEPDEPEPVVVDTPIPVLSIDEIPALVEEWGSGTGEPLDVARRLIGFPIDIGVPDGSTPYAVYVYLSGEEAEADWSWGWSYDAFSPGPTIGEIDAELDDGGAGTVETKALFDELLATLGWRNVAQVISDPSSGAGGPQSVNFAYQSDAATFRLGEIDAVPGIARVWADEDIDFRDGPDQAGYSVEITIESQPNFIPVPMLEALFREVPVAPGARLTSLSFRSWDRSPDSFDAEDGLRYLELSYTCELLPNSAMAARDVYSTGLDGTVYRMGEESFFDEGFVEVVEATIDSNDRWRQPVVVLDRYPGAISVWTDDDGTVMSEVTITLEPNREVLQPLAE